MNNPKFTRGPWRSTEKLSGSENHKGFNLYGVDGTWLGEISPQNTETGDPSEEARATLALIKKAPEMYAKLRQLLEVSRDDGIASWATIWDEVEELLEGL